MPIASAFGPLLLSPLLGPPASGLSGLGTGRLGSAGLKHSASASRRQGYEHLGYPYPSPAPAVDLHCPSFPVTSASSFS